MPAPLNGGTTASVTTTISGGFVTGFTIVLGGPDTADRRLIATRSRSTATRTPWSPPVRRACLVRFELVADASIGVGEPDMTGIWTFVADESSPNTPMIVSLYALNANTPGSLSEMFTSTITDGTIVGGVEIGKMWQWTVTRVSPTQSQLNLNIELAGPASAVSALWTLSNEFLTAPARSALTTNPAVVPNRPPPAGPIKT